jgi:hypothetical protein
LALIVLMPSIAIFLTESNPVRELVFPPVEIDSERCTGMQKSIQPEIVPPVCQNTLKDLDRAAWQI